jgi:hypothetical protein
MAPKNKAVNSGTVSATSAIPVLGLHAAGDEAAGAGERVEPQLREGVGALQLAAGVVEIQPALAGGGVVEGFAESGKVGKAAHAAIIGGGRQGGPHAFTIRNHLWLDPYIFAVFPRNSHRVALLAAQ